MPHRNQIDKMRLAFLVVHSCPLGQPGSKNSGGMNVYVRELADNLGKLGHSVDIYTRAHVPGEPQVIETTKNTRFIHISDGNINETEKVGMYQHLPEFLSNLEQFRAINELQYDHIYSHYWVSGAAGLTLQSQWRVPHTTTFHTLGIVKNKLVTKENEPEIRLTAERMIAVNCNRIIATTINEKQLLSTEFDLNPQKISVVPCGVNKELFRIMDKQLCRRTLKLPPDKKIILCVGRMEKIKGFDRLLEAVTLLQEKDKLTIVIIGGDENDRSEISKLKELALNKQIINNIEFYHAVSQEELPYYYNAADVFVLPSYSESFGMVALEALACGTPVVANRVGDLENIIHLGISGYVLPDNTPELLAAGINKIFLNQNRFDQVEIRRTVIKYDWRNIAADIIRTISN